MRAVVWLFGCLALLWLAQSWHLWHEMRDGAAIVTLWLWILGGAAWVTRGRPRRPASPRVPAMEDAVLKRSAQSAAEKSSHEPWGTPP